MFLSLSSRLEQLQATAKRVLVLLVASNNKAPLFVSKNMHSLKVCSKTQALFGLILLAGPQNSHQFSVLRLASELISIPYIFVCIWDFSLLMDSEVQVYS